MTSTMGALAAVALLAACAASGGTGQRPPVQAAAGQVAADEMTIDTMGGGHFRGRTGSAWTRDEVAAQAASLECGGKRPAAIDIQPVPGGGHSFAGRC